MHAHEVDILFEFPDRFSSPSVLTLKAKNFSMLSLDLLIFVAYHIFSLRTSSPKVIKSVIFPEGLISHIISLILPEG